MLDFYRTPGGRRFIDATVPEIGIQLQRIANSLDRLLDWIETNSGATTKGTKAEPSGADLPER